MSKEEKKNGVAVNHITQIEKLHIIMMYESSGLYVMDKYLKANKHQVVFYLLNSPYDQK